jgi:2-hydroxychromene-2-carboxylate isomerase
MADIRFYFDPVCPFAWMTSTWVRSVRDQRDYDVEWRFVSLRQLNAHLDYDSHFPPEYEAGHTAGLRLLRVAAAARDAHGVEAVDRLYEALGNHIWYGDGVDWTEHVDDLAAWVKPVLDAADLPATLAAAVDDEGWDGLIQDSTDEALSVAGKDVGTPIIHFEPDAEDGGIGFFGPVISRRPSPEEAVELWEHVVALARFGGFAELKRSLRELPQLPALGVKDDEAGKTEDWHAGSRRQKK